MSAVLYLRGKHGGGGSSQPHPQGGQRATRFARHESADEGVELDLTQDVDTLIRDILTNISAREGVSKGRRLAYLNSFVKFLQKSNGAGFRGCGFSTSKIILCLRVCLVHEATVVRVAALRALRYLIQTESDLKSMNEVGVPWLIVRSLDVVLNNSSERLQATRLCQRVLAIPGGHAHFPAPVTRALVAIGFDGREEQDKLYRGSLSLLCQLALLNPMQFIECGGVRVLLHNILGCTSPMVLEAMVGSLLHLLNAPETRDASGVNLQALVAPFTDVHFKHGANEPKMKELDEREVGYQCAKTAIGAVLKSWGGVAHFCQSRNSGLQALVDALYIHQLEIRRTILELICEILGVKFPTWSDEVTVALSAVDPSSPQDSWRLSEGFIVAEALQVLPHLASTTPNITANHMALIVLSFLQRGLLEALVDVIVTGDTFISVRATVLLGEILHLVDKFIPLACYDPTHCVPSLIRYSASADSSPVQQQRAMEALGVLSSLQKIKARPPRASSLFLQSQIEYASYQPKAPGSFLNKLGHVQVTRVLKRDIEANPTKLLKDTGVLNSKDSTTWQWDTILSLIKWAPSVLKRVEDSNWHNFLKRLIDYFKPSANLFARLEVGKGQALLIAKTATALVTFLAEEVEGVAGAILLESLLVDIASQLDEVLRQPPNNPFGAFLSPQKLEGTLSQVYFLLVGRLSNTAKGYRVLDRGDILKRFLNLVQNLEHSIYAKLILGSLSYKEDYPKRILAAALASPFDSARLFATQFLRVLVRAKLSGFSKWGMELLIAQLGDRSRAVSLAALDILEEAIHDKMFLESLISLRPSLTFLGDRGLLLLVTFLSLPSGFKFLSEANFLKNEMAKWRDHFNKRYVELVEVLVRDTVSTLRRGEDGKYPERASRAQAQSKFVDIYVPPHLYGQLAQQKEGLELLLDSGDINALIAKVIKEARNSTPTLEETKDLKAALWALAHVGTSADAVPILEEAKVIQSMVELGRFCPILSVRHTVFHSLCLLCVTVAGAEALRKWGWHAMPRSHHESFTIWSPDLFIVEETRRLLRLRVEAELVPEEGGEGEEFDDNDGNDGDACSAHLGEEESEELLLMEEDEFLEEGEEGLGATPRDGEGDEILKSCSLTTATQASSPLRWSHAHHRSHSDSHTLSQAHSSSTRRRLRKNSQGQAQGSQGEWRWRKESVTESTTSGVSSCDSATKQDHAHTTLSPIPSSASLATNSEPQSPPSRGSSRATLTEPGGGVPPLVASSSFGSSGGGGGGVMGLGRWGSPIHRSLRMRKPLLRMSMMGEESGGSSRGRSQSQSHALMLLKTGSLDRNLILSPGDLFEANRIRVNSSLTSLSTPSFRVRPESRGPCYMGLCVPDDFGAIFLTDSSIPLHVRMTSGHHPSGGSGHQGDDAEGEENEPLQKLGDSFEYHEPSTCLGCTKAPPPEEVRKEALHLVSNLICCAGAKANEQGLLMLKQKFPIAFHDLCLYTELSMVMSAYNLRLPLRRFLQELFFDMPFTEFYEVAEKILQEATPPQVSALPEPPPEFQ